MKHVELAYKPAAWPELPLAAWKPTCETLHMWTQIVGKVRLALSPPLNHWWQVPLYVSSCGLTTSPIPYNEGIFEVEFDFLKHELVIQINNGRNKMLPLRPISVADFYSEFMASLRSLGIDVKIWTTPVEIPNPIPFERDTEHASYDREYVTRFWKTLVLCDAVFKEFRCGFVGKASPVHFFWGSFDLAVTRFSGRRAPPRPDADPITREAYSHEVISAGFWPGSGDIKDAAFYAYAAPEPEGFAKGHVRPPAAFYHPQLREFLLMYDDVRNAASPRTALLDFMQSSYEVGANLAKWNRGELERPAA
jgi:uncharacterized protein DUF5996